MKTALTNGLNSLIGIFKGMFGSRKNQVFFILSGFFLTNALAAEVIGGKLIQIPALHLWGQAWGPWPLSVGILPWPIVFLTTDLVNEYYGYRGVRKITLLTAGCILYAFVLLFVGGMFPAVSFSPVQDLEYQRVFLQSQWIIAGSLVAFLVAQFLDVFVFLRVRRLTGKRMIWLRATGSTVISQGIDTFIVQGLGFYVPGSISMEEYLQIAVNSYSSKLGIAVAITPLIYLGHWAIDRYLAAELKNGE